MITASIAVNKVDKSKFFVRKNGDKMLDITLIETPNSKYDDDYMIVQSTTKEEREKGIKGNILGNAKIIQSKGNANGGKPAAAKGAPMIPTGDEHGVEEVEESGSGSTFRRVRKTQPQKLLEEIIPKDIPHDENEKYPSDPEPLNDAPKFPTIQEQQKYWDDKEKAAEPQPYPYTCPTCLKRFDNAHDVAEHVKRDHLKAQRKWSLARRRAYNAMKAKGWVPMAPPPQEAKVPQVRFCPNCGCGLERWLS